MDALKVVSFLKRRADFGPTDFSEYWRTVHKAHAMKLVEAGFIQGYVQNHAIAAELEGLPAMADGSPELWIDALDTLERLIGSPEYLQGAGPDEANFIAPPVIACVAYERILVEAAPGSIPQAAVKLMLMVTRNPQLDSSGFRERWLQGRSAPLVAGQPLRLSRHAVVGEGPFDGAEFSWWPDLQALCQAWARRDPSAASDLLELGSLRGLLAREEVVVPPCMIQGAR